MQSVIDSQECAAQRELPVRTGGALRLTRSEELLREAQQLVPGLTQSLMKRPEMFAPGAFPVFLDSGQGALVRDVDGNEFIDFVCGLGANTLGHGHPAVVSAIVEHAARGVLHSLPTEIELRAAERVRELTPNAEQVRFFKTGADATSAAVRLARALTGRAKIVTVGYNGWHDHFMFDTKGVPAALAEHSVRMPLAQPEDERALLDLVADHGAHIAVVLLSVPYNRVLSAAFLHALRALCRQRGALFVLDEVVTGFRLALGGAQAFYGIEADYVCLSKGIAAGMPLSAVAGPRARLSVMQELQVSTTFGGELLSLYVCKAVLEVYRDSGYIEHIAQLGRRLREGVNAHAEALGSKLRIVGYDAIPCFRYSDDLAVHTAFMQRFLGAMARRGVLLRRDVNFISGVHTSLQIEHTIRSAGEALRELSEAAP